MRERTPAPGSGADEAELDVTVVRPARRPGPGVSVPVRHQAAGDPAHGEP